MSEFYSEIGERKYKDLLMDPQGADAVSIPCEPGNGDVPAGTLMYRTNAGLYKPATTDQITTSYMLAVLGEDMPTGASVEAGAPALDARAFRSGCFVDGAVFLASNGEVTASHKITLRLMGITFGQKVGGSALVNDAISITYVANNSASPAEDNVVATVLPGTSYTILNNSDSSLGFTAPDGKEFAGWNTKADGTGTDYAAAATYTANADLKLYAVWGEDTSKITITIHANNGVIPEQKYVLTDVDKGVETVAAVPMEVLETWTIPEEKEFSGWSLKTEIETEEDYLPIDPTTQGAIITPTEDTDIYAQWIGSGG